MAYCRKHFLNRTALITIEVSHDSHLNTDYHSPPAPVQPYVCDSNFYPIGCEARADEDDGAGRFLVVSLLLFSLQAAAGGVAVQATNLHPERRADSGALRQRGPGLVHPLCGCA